LEAFKAGKPVACSDIAAFREYGKDAPLYFDAFDSRSIAGAVSEIFNKAELRSALSIRGLERGSQFSWLRSAWLHRALYRKIAGQKLSSEENRELFAA
jgi:glycosyltransferase involved in cell wall biosynthesis